MLFSNAYNYAILAFTTNPCNKNNPLPTYFIPKAKLLEEPTRLTKEFVLSIEVRDYNRRIIDIILTS